MAKLDTDKIQCMSTSNKYGALLHRIPLEDYLQRIVSNGIDLTVLPEDDQRLNGHRLRIFLDRAYSPPLIYVHIDGEFAAQYSYFDLEFAKKFADDDLDDE
jgi:hypothetical protein